MNKQTPVQWLVENLNKIKAWTSNSITLSRAEGLIEKAKQQEKEYQSKKIEKLNIVVKQWEEKGKDLFLESSIARKHNYALEPLLLDAKCKLIDEIIRDIRLKVIEELIEP